MYQATQRKSPRGCPPPTDTDQIRPTDSYEASYSMAQIQVSDPPKLDLDSYIANYKGRTRFHRLYHIGTTSTYLAPEALKQAVTEAKKGQDVALYKKAVSALHAVAPEDSEALLDGEWVNRTELAVKRETARLEQELKGYKNNLIKESIRMGYDDQGRHFYDIGDQYSAAQAYQKERDYATLPVHVLVMNFHLINVFIDQGLWHSVEVTAQRLTGMSNKPEGDKTAPKLNAVLGLAAMSSKRYETAANYFLNVGHRMLNANLDDPMDEDTFNEVLTPNDIGTYGSLCALASMSRQGLQTRVLDNANFRPFLELEPHLRRAISAFVSGRYGHALSALNSYRTDYLLDLHLSPHLDHLYLAISSKALVEYFDPFSSISFVTLGAAFGATENEVVTMAIELIKSRQLDARLDLENGLLVANTVDKRRKVQDEALQMSKEYERTTTQRLLRIEALNAGLEVKAPLRSEIGPGGMDLDNGTFDGMGPRKMANRPWKRNG